MLFHNNLTNPLRKLTLALSIPLSIAALLLTAVVPGPAAPAVEGAQADPAVHRTPLVFPPDFPRPALDADTAFREEDAGFSGYLRVAANPDDASQPRLDVAKVREQLVQAPESSEVRSAGTLVDWGLNFAIIELPLVAAEISPPPMETVSIYIDDQGWIVAYLPKSRPAAAFWKHNPADAGGNLDDNLLLTAINQALQAADPAATPVAHSAIGYFDWTNPACDTFALFTSADDRTVQFVIPYTITDVDASAAALMVRSSDPEATVDVMVDGAAVASAGNGSGAMAAAGFSLARAADTSTLHRMSVAASATDAAAGAVMLLYEKP